MSAIPGTTSNVTAAVTQNATSSSASALGKNGATLAENFTAFLNLLTTQLKNQNPLEPLDTNQFTQQLVQFSQVEQQLKSNDQLATLVALQKTSQATAALGFVGQTVAVDGTKAKLDDGEAVWRMQVPKPATAQVNIISSTGQTVYSGSFSMDAGAQEFVWDGKGANGVQWPEGEYTISIVAKDAAGQPVTIPTEVQGPVDSIDMTKEPPVLSVHGQSYAMDKIKRIIR